MYISTTRCSAVFLSLLLVSALAHGSTDPAADFTSSDGYRVSDLQAACSDEDFYSNERFPASGQSAFTPDAGLDPATRAVLLFDCAEGSLPHARYRIRHHLAPSGQTYGDWISYIEITRFNLGEARYQDVIRYVDPEQRPPREVFGTGPHVSWRMVLEPVQGGRTHVTRAGYRTLAPDKAHASDCLGSPCLALDASTRPAGNWRESAPPALPAATYNEPGDKQLPGPARITQELFELIRTMPPSTELEFNEGASPEQPENTLVLAIDVDGQEGHRYGLMLERNLMDDAIDSLWSERRQVAGGPPRWQQLPVYRRGRN